MKINFDTEDAQSIKAQEKEEQEALDIEEFEFITFNPKSRKILEELEEDNNFEVELDAILADIGEDIDLTKAQSQLILLVMNKLKMIKTKERSSLKELTREREAQIIKHIKDLSHYLINRRSPKAIIANKGIDKPQDRYQYLNLKSRINLRRIIKKFVVYEVYKAMNPYRIAGERAKDNFINNMIIGGMKRATKYTGGSKSEIRTYSKKMIQDLEKKHRSFKKQLSR